MSFCVKMHIFVTKTNIMNKVKLPLLTFLAIPLTLFAGPRSFQQAKKIAERHATEHGIIKDHSEVTLAKSANVKVGSRVKSVSREIPADQTPDYYVFTNGKDKGFTIVSGDDRLPEIIGYSDQGTYNETSLPKSYVNFMKVYENLADKITHGDKQAQQDLAEINSYRSSQSSQVAVAPLLGDIEWSQFAPFNHMCPLYDGTNHAATGCVATAMTQVMAHYRHPKQLIEDIPGYTKSWNGYETTIPAISKAKGTYDWDNILPKYTNGQFNQTQADAVAKLVYHCGAALQMGYGSVSGSFASPTPFAKYFGYDADLMQKVFRYSFTLTEWMQLIDNELSAGRPILYSGTSSQEGGHEFVCDGSDGNGLYHINWGWSGQQNGYFDLTILNPYQEGENSSNAADGYNVGCGMLIGIAPDNGQKDNALVNVPAIIMTYDQNNSKLELAKASRTNASETFSLKITNDFTNQSLNDFYGVRLKFGIKKADGTYLPIGNSSSRLYLAALGTDGSFSVGQVSELAVDYAFPIGKTTIYAIYSTNGYTWLPCAYKGMQPYVVEATETTLSIVPTQLKSEVSAEGNLTSGVKSTFDVTVTNEGDQEYLGYLDIYSSMTSNKPENADEKLYVAVPAHSTISRKIELTPSGKNFYLWITDYKGNILVDGKQFTLTTSSEPVLSIVKAWNNATPDAYETENAYYGKDRVKAPRVDDDKVTFSYEIQNDGGSTTLQCGIGVNNMYPSEMKTIHIPGEGQVTTITRDISPNDVGSKSIISELWTYDETGIKTITIPTSLPSYKLWCVDEASSYTLSALKMVVYVAGKPAGTVLHLPAISNGKFYATYSNLKQDIQITATNGEEVKVYTLEVENGKILKRTERIDGKISKGEGVLIESTSSEVTATALSTEVEKAVGNCLIASENISWDAGYKYYRMTYSDATTKKGLGFYWGSNDGGKFGFTVKPGIAILKVSDHIASAKGFSFDSTETTGLMGISCKDKNLQEKGIIYNLNGQRVSSPFKGICIRNGKKYIIK